MLFKLFGSSTIKLSSLRKPAPAAAPAAPPQEHPHPDLSTPLRIVHAGGFIERYYMAVPAVGIMEKYPRAILARPDVFRRPWDSLIRPEEILTPGEKVYVVPRRTIQKLQRRIRRPAVHRHRTKGDSSEEKNESNMSDKSTTAPTTAFEVLRLSVAWPERKKMDKSVDGRPAAASRVQPKRTRVRMGEMWQSSLEAIDEVVT